MPTTLAEVLAGPLPTTVDQVIARMTAIDAALPAADGVAWFNKMYLRVTQAVGQAIGGGVFRDPKFIARMDVNFAVMYFRPLALAVNGTQGISRSWQALLESRSDPAVAPLQFALAGLNAHINHDLPFAIVQTCTDFGLVPSVGTSQHDDYEALNPVLERVEDAVKDWFATGFIGVWDHAMASVDDRVAHWSLVAARDAAWHNAEVLWALRNDPELTNLFSSGLDGLCGMAGRGLLLHPGVTASLAG